MSQVFWCKIQARASRVAVEGSLMEKHPEPFWTSRAAPKGPFLLLLGFFSPFPLKAARSVLPCGLLGALSWVISTSHWKTYPGPVLRQRGCGLRRPVRGACVSGWPSPCTLVGGPGAFTSTHRFSPLGFRWADVPFNIVICGLLFLFNTDYCFPTLFQKILNITRREVKCAQHFHTKKIIFVNTLMHFLPLYAFIEYLGILCPFFSCFLTQLYSLNM